MNPALLRLQAYPFERLRSLLAGVTAPAELAHIGLSIGEPRHAPPAFALAALANHLAELSSYPATRGLPALRVAMAAALERRFLQGRSHIDPDSQVLPVNGTREALFAFVQACIRPEPDALIAMPNPFYQIYEGAALLAGAEPYFLNTTAASGHVPDLDAVPASLWQRCQLLFLCTPGNPSGAVLSLEYLRHALELAERYNFVIASDECYADLYLDESQPPPSLLNAALSMGNEAFERCIVFHSLSKRSSLPGLRSGLVAGDAALLAPFLLYRTYHGCAMSVPTQRASIAAWSDDAHVRENRRLYQQKFTRVVPLLRPLLEFPPPTGGFYLWPAVQGDDSEFTRELFRRKNLTVLPGSYLARASHGENPGAGRVRLSLVPELAECVEAAERLCDFLSDPAHS